MSIQATFQVIDLTCEKADQSFFPPQVTMTTKSTTQISTVLGWSEFPGNVSSPPKKYKTISWNGSSEQQLWYQGVQIGGAKYDFSGQDQIDTHGNIISTHSKIFSVMCNSAPGGQSPVQQLQFMGNDRANIVGPPYPQNTIYSLAASFIGYFGTNNTQYSNLFGPTELCPAPINPYEAVGDVQGGAPFVLPQQDCFGFWGNSSAGGQNSFLGAAPPSFSGLVASNSDNGSVNVSFNPYALKLLPPGVILEQFSQLQTPIGIIPRPADWSATATVIFTNSFSAVLGNEYTDAEALSNAQVVIGNGKTAQNFTRTTGFVSNVTTVAYTLSASNLITGSSYVISVDLWDIAFGTTTKQYVVFGDSNGKAVITDVIPLPALNHSVTVTNARIAFGP